MISNSSEIFRYVLCTGDDSSAKRCAVYTWPAPYATSLDHDINKTLRMTIKGHSMFNVPILLHEFSCSTLQTVKNLRVVGFKGKEETP
jgi:hypothetical protein